MSVDAALRAPAGPLGRDVDARHGLCLGALVRHRKSGRRAYIIEEYAHGPEHAVVVYYRIEFADAVQLWPLTARDLEALP